MANEKTETKPEPKTETKPEPKTETKPERVVEAAPAPKANLTRDSIEETMRGRLIAEGKDPKEAAATAKKRALEIIPE